jgi:hypothetical protein
VRERVWGRERGIGWVWMGDRGHGMAFLLDGCTRWCSVNGKWEMGDGRWKGE